MLWPRSTIGSWRGLKKHYTCRHNSSLTPRQNTTHEPFRILFFGRDEFSCAVFRELHAAKDVWQGLQVVTQPDERVGRNGSQVSISPLKTLSQSLDVAVHEIPQQRQAFRTWKPPYPFDAPTSDLSLDLSHLLITASFGRIISSPLLNRFHPQRRLNVHPSLLPHYRGPAPLQRTLIDGCSDTGVSIIGMTRYVKGQAGGVDLGDVWAQETHAIESSTSFVTLRDQLAQQGGRLIVQVLRDILQGTAHPRSQESLGHSEPYPYAHFITPDDYRIRWNEQDANQLVQTFNAIGHQHSLTTWLPDGATSLQLHSPAVVAEHDNTFAHIARPGQGLFHKPSGAVFIRCARNTLLAVKTLKQERMKLIPAKDFWNGIRGRPAWLSEIENEGRKWQYIQFCEPPTQACQSKNT